MPDDTKELIDVASFTRLLVAAGVGLFIVSLVAGAAWGRRADAARAGLLRGLGAGLVGPAALALWWVYNRIEDRYGLDSVRAVLTNLAIFVVAGVLGGSLLAWLWRATGPGIAAAGDGSGDRLRSEPGPND